MNMQFQDVGGGNFTVFWKSENIGTVSLRHNTFHASTCYFDMKLSTYDAKFAPDFGKQLSAIVQKPLQIMLDSDQKERICFLEAAGFQCKRKCYEIEVAETNLMNKIRPNLPLRRCYAGEPLYLDCAKLLYQYYRDTHNEVSPLTAAFWDFFALLPNIAYYMQEAGTIQQAIFVEDNEVAYCCCSDVKKFEEFASVVLGELFSHNSNIFFEADDCDRAAMRLLGLFHMDLPKSYNTYIRVGTAMQ